MGHTKSSSRLTLLTLLTTSPPKAAKGSDTTLYLLARLRVSSYWITSNPLDNSLIGAIWPCDRDRLDHIDHPKVGLFLTTRCTAIVDAHR